MHGNHQKKFGPIALKRIEYGLGYSESMFYLFQSDWTKNIEIASLNRRTPKFSGVGLKLTWCQPFGVQVQSQVTQIRAHKNSRF